MSSVARPLLKNYITAKSPNGLRRLMMQNNARKGYSFIYEDVQFVKGRWYAWYNEELRNSEIPESIQEKDGTTGE